MKRKIAAILAADVVGYSRLVAEDEGRALEHLLACREIFSEFVERGGGRIFNTAGDAVLAEFPSAVEALLAGIDIQDCLRTHYDAQPDDFRMQFRMGMTIGDVVEREGDLLGDGVNVAARLEGLAAPGGICISGIMHEQVLNKVSVRFRDVGLKTVKNIPAPIHVYALDGSVPARAKRLARLRVPVRAAAVVTLISVAALFSLLSTRGAGGGGSAWVRHLLGRGRDEGPGIYGVAATATRDIEATHPLPYDPAETPFVTDAGRLKLKNTLASHGRNHALALTRKGAYYLATSRPTPEDARNLALQKCAELTQDECGIFEINGDVVWPRRIPVPPPPWIDRDAVPSLFDGSRLKGFDETKRNDLSEAYAAGRNAKALALGPPGTSFRISGLATDQEAARIALEACGDQQGVACRLVAVDDKFVVEDTTSPAKPALDVVDRCDQLAGTPFDVGRLNGSVSFAAIDSKTAITVCWDALDKSPSDPSLQLSLGRAIEKSGLFPEKALDLYRSAASAGDAAALNAIGAIYDAGRLGVTQDRVAAASFFQKAAHEGNPDAMRSLAVMYSTGVGGVPVDAGRASMLLAQADQAEAAWKPKPR